GSHEPASISCSTSGWQSARDHAADVLQDITSLWVWVSPNRAPDELAGVMVHMNLPPFPAQPRACQTKLRARQPKTDWHANLIFEHANRIAIKILSCL
ncbi:hypothetical protein, partial [Pseudomonas xionganensis]|uniref:hypothetical protein n=1 Tax=Pseudomonas xionganensis TaxID=2654845 RepID=UPI001C49841D